MCFSKLFRKKENDMQQTSNLELNLPEDTDYIESTSREAINDNFEILDPLLADVKLQEDTITCDFVDSSYGMTNYGTMTIKLSRYGKLVFANFKIEPSSSIPLNTIVYIMNVVTIPTKYLPSSTASTGSELGMLNTYYPYGGSSTPYGLKQWTQVTVVQSTDNKLGLAGQMKQMETMSTSSTTAQLFWTV